jgi:hypothetical protein
MSEVASTEAKPKPSRATADKKVLAEVERWMALIREISLEEAKTEPV